MAYNKESNMYEGFIYIIENKVNNHKYIGQTLQTIKKRWHQHKLDSKKYDYSLYRAIRKYGLNNFSIKEVEKIEDSDRYKLSRRLDEREIYWIDYYGTFSNGYNQTIGGQNNAPNKFPERPINEYNLQGDLLYTYKSAIDASDATGFSRSDISSCSARTKVNRVQNRIFRYADEPLTEEEKAFYIKKYPKIYQYDLDGNLINKFDFIQDAVNYLSQRGIKVINGNISKCCQGKVLSVGGYVWRKYPDIFNTYRVPILLKRIEKRDISNGEILEMFKNFDEIVKKYNYNKASINNCCNNRNGSAYGYHWCYEGEFNKNNLKRIRFKPIVQYNINGDIINEFNSAYEAVDKLNLNGASSSALILAVCNGKSNYAYGYIWRYKNDSFNKYEIKKPYIKEKINKYINDVYVETFSNAKDAANSVNSSCCSYIRDCCKHLRDTYKDAKWYYQSDISQPDKTKVIA